MKDRQYLNFIGALRETDPTDDGAFQKRILDGMDLCRLLDKDVAREFGVSRPTVTRWRNGTNAPHPALRKHVYSWLQSRAQALHNRMQEKRPALVGASAGHSEHRTPMFARSDV
jgi:hypothetical protein